MGQSCDSPGAKPEARNGLADETGSLREAAVAIDPPPRGALGIRDLLDLLEKEIAREFPAQTDNSPGYERSPRRRARKRA